MVFDEDERASTQPPTPLPAPTAETVFSSVVSLAQRVARIRSEVVTRVVLDKQMCDAEISRFMFAPDSQIIAIGRAKRTFTGQLRRAITARDKHCQFPRCTAPPRRCEGHHSQHWFRDHGDTDARSGVLLCWHHHDYVHDNGIQITWKPGGG